MSNKNTATEMVAVTDAKGNAVTYALDNLGNRIGKEIKDPTDVLQRISRSFDALNRMQQVIAGLSEHRGEIENTCSISNCSMSSDMKKLFSLMMLVIGLALSFSAKADFPAKPPTCTVAPCFEWQATYNVVIVSTAWYKSPSEAADDILAKLNAVRPGYSYVLTSTTYPHYVTVWKWPGINDWDTGVLVRVAAPSSAYTCPDTATLKPDGVTCTCKSGYIDNPQGGNSCAQVVESVQAEAPQVCSAQRSDGNPIYALTGAKKEFVSTGLLIGGIDFVLTYDSTRKLPTSQGTVSTVLVEPNALGALWKSSFHRKLQVTPNLKKALLSRGNGTVVNFDGTGAGVFTGETGNPNKLASITGGYLFTDFASGDLETFDSAGKLLSITTARGQVLTYTYSGDNLTKIQSNDGRVMLFTYANQLITRIMGPDGNSIGFLYDAAQNLVSMTWPDGKVRGFLYENSTFPWALTGKTDENNSRLATFSYDAQGRAVGTELAGGVNSFNMTYTSPPARVVTESFDVANNVLYRTSGWQAPTGVAVTQPNGQTVSVESVNVLGMPSIASQSQAAGSGCSASISAQAYDVNGNIASRNDFTGQRTCYGYDSANRETVHVEGLATSVACSTVTPDGATLPTGARKITTSWHPDWRLPVQVNELTRRITTVYQGQPDPFNSNVAANCTTAANLPNGKPMPVVCKQVEQALLGSGSVDTTVAAKIRTHTYDVGGRELTSTDANNRTTNYSYYDDTAFSGNAPGSYDPDYEKVVLLLHGNGANGSTSIADHSLGAKTVTPLNDAKVSTAQSLFGGSSITFDGTADFLQIPYSTDFAFGAGDFTIETSVYKNANNANGSRLWSPGDYFDGVLLQIDANGNFSVYLTTTANTWTHSLPVVAGLANGQWHHLAVVRSGGSIFAFVNGVKYVVTTALGGTALYSNSSYPRVIGGQGGVNRTLNGYIDEFRITKGKARYTANFTPLTAEFLNNGQMPSPTDIGHAAGDLQSVTNAAGHVTQYTQYDRAGRVRQMIDPKGVVTDISYTPRGWVSTVTSTAPGGAGRTTSYTYDGVGQLTGVAQPDGTTLSYSYDAAHRLVGVTDAKGNSMNYTLDNVGNRIAEEIKDPTGVLQRSISRSFDALNRVQQVIGAAR